MDSKRNILIGIVVGVLIVGVAVYVTGLTRLLLSPFGSSAEYESSEYASAPELSAGYWINSDPLKLKDLRGRVVLIEFWTFGCFNCRNTVPHIKSLSDRYRDKGLTVIGVHSPETAAESNIEDLRREVASLGISYPVVTDNDHQTWNAYNAYAWPTIFLLDKQGRIRWMRVGEGNYDETERLIQKLLAEHEK